MNLEELGITKEELVERIVDRAADDLLQGRVDSEISSVTVYEDLRGLIQKRVREALDKKAESLCDEVMVPRARELVDEARIKLQQWGKEEEQLTLEQYIVRRCDSYLTDKVRFDGMTPEEHGDRSWCGQHRETRVAWLVDKLIKDEISREVRDAMRQAKSRAIEMIRETMQRQIETIVAKATGF